MKNVFLRLEDLQKDLNKNTGHPTHRFALLQYSHFQPLSKTPSYP